MRYSNEAAERANQVIYDDFISKKGYTKVSYRFAEPRTTKSCRTMTTGVYLFTLIWTKTYVGPYISTQR